MWIKKLEIKNFGVFEEATFVFSDKVNLLVGTNDTGKSSILKLIYAVIMAYRERMSERKLYSKPDNVIFGDWFMKVFLPDKLGDLVRKFSFGNQRAEILVETEEFICELSFSRKAEKQMGNVEIDVLSAKERFQPDEIYLVPPFDVVFLDEAVDMLKEYPIFPVYIERLLNAVKVAKRLKPRLSKEIQEIMQGIREKMNGHLTVSDEKFIFRRGQTSFNAKMVADGFRKLGVFDLLLRSNKLRNGTILLVDEPESTLNPEMAVMLVELLYKISIAKNVQIFVSTHDYFVASMFRLKALENKDVPSNALFDLTEKFSRVFSIYYLVKRNAVVVESSPLSVPLGEDNPIVATFVELFEMEKRLNEYEKI